MRWLFALLLLCGVAFAQSQPTPKQTISPPQKSEQQPDKTQKEKQITKSDKGSPPYWVSRIETIIASKLQNASNYCANSGIEEQDKWLHNFVCEIKITDVVIAIFSILLVFVTVGLVIVGYVQARRMRVTARQQRDAFRSRRRSNFQFMQGNFTGGIGITPEMTICENGNTSN